MRLHYQHRTIAFSEIEQVLLEDDHLPAQLKNTLVICNRWRKGEEQFVFQTSGSTGVPKIIHANREQLLASAHGTIEALHLNHKDHFLLCLNTRSIGGAMVLIRAMLLEAEITLMDPSSDILEQLDQTHPFTVASFVPMQLDILKQKPELMKTLDRFEKVLIGGAGIDLSLDQQLKKSTTNLYHTYGMTETLSHIALRQLGKEDSFFPLKGIDLKIDERGCLAIKGKVTNDEWIITNDMVDLQADFSFKVLGRADDVINTGGFKVFPAKVEAAMQELLPFSLFIYSTPDEKFGQQVAAFVLTSTLDTVQLTKALKEKLHPYEIPKTFYCLSRFITTANGKIDKIATAALAVNQ
jgi:O-succinylbenzoic acid--CoA ligase